MFKVFNHQGMQIKSTCDPISPGSMPITKEMMTANSGMEVGKAEALFTDGGRRKLWSRYGNRCGSFSES